jgi:hypothetical protein
MQLMCSLIFSFTRIILLCACHTYWLTLSLLMSYIYIYIYIYGATSKARNLTYIYGRDFLLEILLLEPGISLIYAWKTNKYTDYSFMRTRHVTRHNTPIHNILSAAPQLNISQKALGTLPEDGNVMPKHVEATRRQIRGVRWVDLFLFPRLKSIM